MPPWPRIRSTRYLPATSCPGTMEASVTCSMLARPTRKSQRAITPRLPSPGRARYGSVMADDKVEDGPSGSAGAGEAAASASVGSAGGGGPGGAQKLLREIGGFENFAVSFSIISILTGAVLLYGYGLKLSGPVINT